MTSGRKVVAFLEGQGVSCALIGGLALAAHGIARATLDTDLLVADQNVLKSEFWNRFVELGPAEIRRGDAADPLLGVVRFSGAGEPVDVIVGRLPWTQQILDRRVRIAVQGSALPLVDEADLILLKLFAGGPQDLLDARLLLAANPQSLRQRVEERLSEAPELVCALWQTLDKG